jgi:hypothetical protein
MIPAGGKVSSGGSRAWAWRVFATCWLVYTLFWTPYIVREHFPALALAERGSLNVDRYLGWTEDIFAGPKGGAYINNNPGASLAGALPLLLLRPVLVRVDGWNQKLPRPRLTMTHDDEEFFWRILAEGRVLYFLFVAFVTVAMVMAPATAGTAAYLCSRLTEAGLPAASAAKVAILYGLGTPVLFRAGHLNHNLLVGDAGITALLLLWDPEDRPLHPARATGAGLLAGYAVLCDYSGAVVAAITALYVWLRSAGQPGMRRLGVMGAYVGGVLPGVAALAIYQAWAFGSLYLPSQQFMPATAPTSRGYRGLDWPSPRLMWANFFDAHFGLFAYCPALILAFAAPFATRVRYRVPAREMRILLTYFVLFVLFCAANQYSWLQPKTGFRYLVPVVPALAVLAMQAAQALPRVVRWVVASATCAQSLIMAVGHQNTFMLSLSSLWQRRLALPWMMRLGDAGVPVTWVWTLVTYVLLALAVRLIWLAPGLWKRRHARRGAADSCHPAAGA